MSKRYKQMDKCFQIWNMKRGLRFVSIQPDTVDIFALIDSTLYYPENEKNILQKIGVNKHGTKKMR